MRRLWRVQYCAFYLTVDLLESAEPVRWRVRHGRLSAQQPQPPPSRHCDIWFLIRKTLSFAIKSTMGTSLPTLQRLHRRAASLGLAGTVGLNCVLAMPKSSCNPSKRVEDTSLSLLTSTFIDSGSCARSLANGRPDPSSGEKPKTVVSTSVAGTSGLPTKSCSTGPSDSVSLSQDHGRGRNRRRRLLGPGFDASPTRMPRNPYRHDLSAHTINEP